MGEFFHIKALHEGTNFLGQIYGQVFHTEANDHIMQGG